MNPTIFLDSGPLGLATNPKLSEESRACYAWLESMVRAGRRVVVPEIVDYEIRRELLRAGKSRGLRRLDATLSVVEYVPITTLAAQALTSGEVEFVVATTNVGHLSRFVSAAHWNEIV
jgi:predicted nucleic acid-binding protein